MPYFVLVCSQGVQEIHIIMLGDENQQNIVQLHVKVVLKVDSSKRFLVYVYRLIRVRARPVAKALKGTRAPAAAAAPS